MYKVYSTCTFSSTDMYIIYMCIVHVQYNVYSTCTFSSTDIYIYIYIYMCIVHVHVYSTCI